MGEPSGLRCPGCGEPPVLLMGGGTQAFCGTDDCPWWTWDPTKTLAELNANAQTVDLRSSEEERQIVGCPDCGGAGCTPDMQACSTCFGTGRAAEDLGHLTDGGESDA